MQLDYTQFICKLEKLTTLKPIPNREFVDLYVKAYYLQENNLEDWIQQHRVGHRQLFVSKIKN